MTESSGKNIPSGLITAESHPNGITLKLRSGVMIVASPKQGEAVGVVLQGSGVQAPHLLKWIQAIKDRLRGKSVEWKIIGNTFLVQHCEAVFAQNKIPVAKSVTRPQAIEIVFIPAKNKLMVAKEETAAPATITVKPKKAQKMRVLVVDDSPSIIKLLQKILGDDPGLEVVGGCLNPLEAEKMIEQLQPNVITLDIHMPHMNGVELLKRIWPKYQIPCVMVSAISIEDGSYVLDALEHGAIDYIRKPSMQELQKTAPNMIERIKAAAQANVTARHKPSPNTTPTVQVKGDLDLSRIIAIGSSTGGTEALRVVLTQLPANIPPIVIVQHIPPVFSRAFSERMNTLCRFEVKEAENNDEVKPNRVLIAPGGLQMRIVRDRSTYRVVVEDAPPVNRHKPSVDVLFNSIATEVGANSIGVILTGMGADGARGLLAMRNKGSRTIAQNEETCVVYGMPREAVSMGGTELVKPLPEIVREILQLACETKLSKTGS